MNSKQRCARYAQSLIKEGMIVGLGGGQTIQYLIEEIKEKNRNLKIVTPSAKTAMLCAKRHGCCAAAMDSFARYGL